ncbi:MAG TPA: hypothetical protein VHZ78_13520 [Rhizomicrobium sp.]|jgi:hypothetical protein|nr:hypothetical protein [Rhizomicrobium sp.]
MEYTIAFLTGHLLVLISVLLVSRYLSRVPNLQQRVDYALEFTDRPRQLRALQDWNQKAQEEKAVLQAVTRRLDEVRKGKAFMINPAALKSDIVTGAIATIVFYLGDSGLLAKLSGPANLFSLDFLEWCLLGGPVAAITLAICHWIIHSAISDAQRPAVALRRAKLGAWISGALAIGAIFAVYSARTVDLTLYPWSETVVQVGMWVLTIGFAIAGGFASSVATIASEEASLDQSLARNTARLEDYGRHLEILDRRIKELDFAGRDIAFPLAGGIGLMPDARGGDANGAEPHRGPNGAA